MHSLRRGTVALALAIVTSVGLSAFPGPFNTIFSASAQAPDNIPGEYQFFPAEDAAAYESELKTFEAIYVMRALYYQAAYQERTTYFSSSTQAQMQAMTRSYQASHMAKARLALAILRAEGNTEARALDINAVGFDPAMTAQAVQVLEAPTWQLRDEVWRYFDLEPTQSQKTTRFDIFVDGLYALQNVVAGGTSYDFDPLVVINWQTHPDFVAHALSFTLPSQEVANMPIATLSPLGEVDTAAVTQAANQNRSYLATLYGSVDATTAATNPAPPAPVVDAPQPPSDTVIEQVPADDSQPEPVALVESEVFVDPQPEAAPVVSPAPRRSNPAVDFFRRVTDSLGWNAFFAWIR